MSRYKDDDEFNEDEVIKVNIRCIRAMLRVLNETNDILNDDHELDLDDFKAECSMVGNPFQYENYGGIYVPVYFEYKSTFVARIRPSNDSSSHVDSSPEETSSDSSSTK